MKLTPATRLGPYEILAPLGAGGMGEVFRAKDRRLDRTVAIKVLSAHVDPRRLEQEARAISSLSHPNICTLFDVGDEEGTNYLVMEYLDGETLSSRLSKKPLPFDEALRFAREIAGALDEAHRRGVVHRDLKPGNIMLVKSGLRISAKLLDFGLATIIKKNPEPGDVTQTVPLTVAGMVIGTPSYMAPEQLEGRPADARTDIYACGLVLQEMFQKNTTPQLAVDIAERCVAKDREERWQSAHDLLAALELIRVQTPAPVAAKRRSIVPWIIASAGLAMLMLALVWMMQDRRVPDKPVAFAFGAPQDTSLTDWPGVPSPDGLRIAFVATDGSGRTAVWVRSLGTQNARRIEGTDEASGPFWSPNGEFIGFFAQGKLKKISFAGGPAESICNIQTDLGASWGASGDIVFAPWNRIELYRVPASGGTPQPVTVLDSGRRENSHRWPHFLPDGRHFLFTARSSVKENTAILVGSLDSKETKRLLPAQSNAQYSPPGYLLFGREGTLMAQRFDANSVSLKGDAFPVAGGVEHATASASALFSVSADGSLLSYRQAKPKLNQLAWFDREGVKVGSTGPKGDFVQPRLSPDGQRVAVVSPDKESGNRGIWLIDVASGRLTRFTFNPANDWWPLWSPDGTQIAFASDRNGKSSIYRKAVNGIANEELIVPADNGGAFPDDWSQDGRLLIYGVDAARTSNDLWIKPFSGPQKPYPFLATKFIEDRARFSPDGKWVAYSSDESGAMEVYVKSLSGPAKLRVSTGGGDHARWRKDGKELFYVAPGEVLTSVDLTDRESLEPGIPKPLFRACSTSHTLRGNEEYFDVAQDGKRFIVDCVAPESTQQDLITVSTHWSSTVKAAAH